MCCRERGVGGTFPEQETKKIVFRSVAEENTKALG